MLELGRPYELLPQVDSTNNYIAEAASKSNLAEGTAILSFNQRKGRGQRERSWKMVSGKDIAVSYLLHPQLDHIGLVLLNKSFALGVRNVVSKLTESEVHVKWPNDIYIGTKKVAGLLIEPTWADKRCKMVILGVGLNVNSTKDELLPTAASLFLFRKTESNLLHVFELLSKELSLAYHRLIKGEGDSIAKDYDQHLIGRGQVLQYETTDGTIDSGRVEGVDEQGRIALYNTHGRFVFAHGEITIKDYSSGV